MGINHVPYINEKVPSHPGFRASFPKKRASSRNSSEKGKNFNRKHVNCLRSLAAKSPGEQALIHLIKPVPLEVLALPAAPTCRAFEGNLSLPDTTYFAVKEKGNRSLKGFS